MSVAVAVVEPKALEPDLSAEDRAALREAVCALERPSFAARLSNLVGRPLELLGHALPAVVSEAVSRASEKAMRAALNAALASLRQERPVAASPRVHKILAATSGAVGGAFGLFALAVELPVSTTLMLRAIASIAKEEGEDLGDPETALACLQVFALGGGTASDHLHESGYLAARAALARSLTEAARYVTERGLIEESAPALVRFLAQIAARFGLVVSQKVAAQAVPVLGAIGGAAANAAFMDHFQSVARAHFTVRRLERVYGAGKVRALYEAFRREFNAEASPPQRDEATRAPVQVDDRGERQDALAKTS
jgi:hypothetical protein